MNNNKAYYWGFGILAFLVTFIVYSLTVQPSVPFWDCGEFSAAAIWQQVPHPPGAPLFLMLGSLFQLIIPFGDLGWRMNMMSVVSTSFTILLLYLITVKVIMNFRKEKITDLADNLMVYGSAFVGALAFCFSDTLWFNGVESEVYATSSLFTALVVYLMMKWNEVADNPGHERYLLLIAYILGLSTGVHLLAILTVFSIIMVIYFRKYQINTKSFVLMGIIALLVFFITYQFVIMWLPTMLAGDSPFKNEARERIIEDSPVMTLFAIAIIGGAIALLWYGIKRKYHMLKLATTFFLLILFGFTTYTQILLRSNANPPMNENEPKNFPKLVSYLGREQYGEQTMWPRRTDYNDEQKKYYYNQRDENGNYVYGEWNEPESKRVVRKDGQAVSVPDWSNVNTEGELNYLWKYQIVHMYLRYFFWNFVGRQSDVQDADFAFLDKGDADILNYKSGFADQFPVRFFALPLLLGLLGLYFHFTKDKKMAWVYLVMFLLMGVLAAIAQNQQNPQPRERDYFYTGSFMVFCMWIGLGTYALVELIFKQKKTPVFVSIIIAGCLILVPVNMAIGGWNIHTRAGNYIPFDYSYNILQSCEKDAILFTNGDNDTFPLWFLQDVEGVRRDVRVVNLSLGQTLWYIDQLKNREPWGAKKIPLSFSDESLRVSETDDRALSYDFGEAKNISIPVKKEILAEYTDDQNIINSGQMNFTFVGRQLGERDGKTYYVFYVNNKLILDILQQTKFERPVYFSSSVGPDVFSGLGRHLRYEGMAMRVCPVPVNSLKTGKIYEKVMEACLMNVDNSNNFSREPKYGFKLRNLDGNSYYYYDEVHRRLMTNYRILYLNYATYQLETKKDSAKCIKIIDLMNKYISPVYFPLYHDEESQIAMLYNEAGDKEKAREWARRTIKSCNEIFSNNKLRRDRVETLADEMKGRHGVHKSAAEAYKILGDYNAAREKLMALYTISRQALTSIQGNPQYQNEVNQVQKNIYDILGNLVGMDETEIELLENQGKKKEALEKADSLYKKYIADQDPLIQSMARYIDEQVKRLNGNIRNDTAKNQ